RRPGAGAYRFVYPPAGCLGNGGVRGREDACAAPDSPSAPLGCPPGQAGAGRARICTPRPPASVGRFGYTDRAALDHHSPAETARGVHGLFGPDRSRKCPGAHQEACGTRSWADAPGETSAGLVGQASALGVSLSPCALLLDESSGTVVFHL